MTYNDVCNKCSFLFDYTLLIFCLPYHTTGWMFDKSGHYDGGYTFLGILQALGVLAVAIDHLVTKVP